MRTPRHLRPLVCVLLAVSTVIGTAPVVAGACACPLRSTTPAPSPVAVSAEAKHACCASHTKTPACCASKAGRCCGATTPDANPPADHAAACVCVQCACGSPDVPPADPAPPSAPGDAGTLQAAAASPVPPAFLALPAAERPARPGSVPLPSNDLVSCFARLTC